MAHRRTPGFPCSPALAFAAVLGALVAPTRANAQRELLTRPGEKGHLVLDQIAGFRGTFGAEGGGNVAFLGPLGFSVQEYHLGRFSPSGLGEATLQTTTFYLAPSADYFILDHVSLGGLLELSTTSSRVQAPPGLSIDRPGTTNIAFLPRAGYLFSFGDRFAIWPRGGIGYVVRERVIGVPGADAVEQFSAFAFDADIGFLYRFTEAFFARLGPGFTVSLGGSRGVTTGTTTAKADASVFQFSVLGGFGVMLDLL